MFFLFLFPVQNCKPLALVLANRLASVVLEESAVC